MIKSILLLLSFLFCITIANSQSQIQNEDAFNKLREGLRDVWKVKPLSMKRHQKQLINRLTKPLNKLQNKYKYLAQNQQTNKQINRDQEKPLASISQIINVNQQFKTEGQKKTKQNDKQLRASYLSLNSIILITAASIVLLLGLKYLRSKQRVVMIIEQNKQESENIVTV